MEDDFFLPESDPPHSTNRKFLRRAVSLLAAFILLSLCAIALLVVEKQAVLIALWSTPTVVPSITPRANGLDDERLTASSTPGVRATVESPAAQQTPMVELTKGMHRIIEYKDPGAPTPHSPHRIIRYGQQGGNSGDNKATSEPDASE